METNKLWKKFKFLGYFFDIFEGLTDEAVDVKKVFQIKLIKKH